MPDIANRKVNELLRSLILTYAHTGCHDTKELKTGCLLRQGKYTTIETWAMPALLHFFTSAYILRVYQRKKI